MLKGKTPLLVALALGLLAGVLAYTAIKTKEAAVREGWTPVAVVVAKRDIPQGTVITADMMANRRVPEQFVTSSVVKPDKASFVEGSKVLVPLQAGDPLLWSQFASTKDGERLSTKVQKKGRAITIDASPKTSVGGWIRPNDHVDLIGTFRDPQTNDTVAVTLLQNIIVLATGKITGTTNVNLLPEADRDYTNITLLVIPEEAEIITLAQELGSLTVSLRNEDDVDMIEERGRATISTLLSGERTRVLEQRRQEVIQIIKGSGERSSVGSRGEP